MDRQLQLLNKSVKISCIVPVHNEQSNIVSFIEQLQLQLGELTDMFEIIIVDDGSTDNSVNLIKPSIQSPFIKLLTFSRNFGKEAALSAGLKHATGDVSILIDCDFQHPIKTIPEFLNHWITGYDMVFGVRNSRDDESYLKRHASEFFYQIMKWSTNVDIPANAGDFRLLDKKVVSALQNCPEKSIFMKGLYAWVGFKSIAVPFEVQKRTADKSSWHYKHLIELAITGITTFSNIPLRMWGIIGFIISCISLTYAAYIYITTLIYGIDVPGYATLSVAIMFFGGIQLLSVGILGEYIARIFHEVKARPKFIIDEKIGFEHDLSITQDIPQKQKTDTTLLT